MKPPPVKSTLTTPKITWGPNPRSFHPAAGLSPGCPTALFHAVPRAILPNYFLP